MDFGQPFSLDPLPSGWQHRKFWTRSRKASAALADGRDGAPELIPVRTEFASPFHPLVVGRTSGSIPFAL